MSEILKFKPDEADENPDWLSKLPVGTQFLARQKDDFQSIDLVEYSLQEKTRQSAFLRLTVNGNHVFTWVLTQRFSSKITLVEILERPQQPQVVPTGTPETALSDTNEKSLP